MALLKQLALKFQYFTGTLFYLSYAPKALYYSLYRDWLEKQFSAPRSPAPTLPGLPGKLLQAEQTPQGATFYFEQAELTVEFLTPDLVRLDWQPGILPIPYAIATQDWAAVQVTLEQQHDGWSLSSYPTAEITQTLQIWVGFDGSLKCYNAAGQLLRQELPPQRQGEAWTHEAVLQPEEHIYGLGERAACLNLRAPKLELAKDGEVTQQARTYRMWNYDAAGMYGSGSDPLYICIPVYLGLHSQGSYLAFYENSYRGEFRFEERAIAHFEGGALRYYLMAGSPAHLLERYTTLTGRAPLPPRWALGYHQSRWGYETEQAVRDTAEAFKARNLPLSAIHLDIDVQVGFRAFTIDPDRFPKLGAFTRELAEEGIRFITILNPGIRYSRKDKLCMEGRNLGALCLLPNGEPVIGPVWPGWCVFPDFTNPVARTWWSRQYEYMLDLGVAGFWHDMNEPAAFILWGDRSLPPHATRHHMEGRGGDHLEAHNIYGMLQSKAGYESLKSYRPDQRPFIVSRAGWAGLQRYAWTWTGDVECTWSALRQTIATVVGLGLSGVPYSGPDVGGFQGNPSSELYLRWFQMSTFLTFFRTHSSNNVEHRTPWTYGEPTLSITRQFLELRYQLLPYFYTLAWEASQKGHPPVRPVLWADPQDATLWSVEDAFLLGSLLVCPIYHEGGRSRSVTLPAGQWYNFWSDELLEGPATVEIAADLEQIPLLVQAGTILPLEKDSQLTLHLYPPTQGTGQAVLYSDAGDGYGPSRLDRFWLTRFADGVELTWEQQGDYEFPYKTIALHLHGAEIQQAWVEGVEVEAQGQRIEGDRLGQPLRQAYLKFAQV